MKRPPVVIFSMLLFGLLAILGVVSAVKLLPLGIGEFVAGSTIPIFFAVCFFGVLLRKGWVRIFGAATISLNALITAFVAGYFSSEITLHTTMVVAAIVLLELLWACWLGMGKASKDYFHGSVNV
ncbi:NADH:ubiquinone oxidoreductase subunit K [Marinobacter sp. MBR-99]|uniref:hypothetical protein n=1 Tax=Marinobacter sp. MBR-99 TaxID=3156461 RepID=UPI003395D238